MGLILVTAEFKQFLTKNGINHVTIAPYHPSSNGCAEPFVQSMRVQGRNKLRGGEWGNKSIQILVQVSFNSSDHSWSHTSWASHESENQDSTTQPHRPNVGKTTSGPNPTTTSYQTGRNQPTREFTCGSGAPWTGRSWARGYQRLLSRPPLNHASRSYPRRDRKAPTRIISVQGQNKLCGCLKEGSRPLPRS